MTGWSTFETPMLNTFPAGALAWHSALASIKNINHFMSSF